jgi:hypothetical protein
MYMHVLYVDIYIELADVAKSPYDISAASSRVRFIGFFTMFN